MRTKSALVALCAGALLFCTPMLAHHGTQVSYQVDKTITLHGTVTEWDFAYPHPQIYFDIKNESGQLEHWAAELLPTPIMMKNMKVGWSRATMKPGDEIVLTANPSKVAGAKVCLARKLLVNGKEMPLGNAAPGRENKQ
jgi:Family of unknown function (DUF6152)